MTIQEIANRFNELAQQEKKWFEIQDELFDEHVRSIEPPHASYLSNAEVFDLTKEGDKTKIIFTHTGLNARYECYQVCEEAWGSYIHDSLYNYITNGKGSPNPKERDTTQRW